MSNNRKTIDELASAFRALGNPHRLDLFARLVACCPPGVACCDSASAGRSVGEVAEWADLAPSTVSHHLKELRTAGLIRMERDGQRIECGVSGDTLRALAEFFGGCLDGRPFPEDDHDPT